MAIVTGTDDPQSLNGTATADIVRGFGGNDTLDGKAGADRLYGGNGNDTYIVDNAGDLVIEGAPTPFAATLASTLTGGGQSSLDVFFSSISGDGRYVVFEATSTDFITRDLNGRTHLFFKDLQTGTLSRVDVLAPGALFHGGSADLARVSADGSVVGFRSFDPGLTVPPRFGFNVYSRDMAAPNVADVSQSSSSANFNYFHDISADGRYLVFSTNDPALAPLAVQGGRSEIVFVDTSTHQFTIASSNGTSSVAFGQSNGSAGISPDGRYVAFSSSISNLVPNDANGSVWDVYLRDMLQPDAALAITRVSTSSSGVQGNAQSGVQFLGGRPPSIDVSEGGAFVMFDSDATNLVVGDSNRKTDVFVKDTHTGQTTRISTSTAGVQGNADSHGLSISADGRYVLFYSEATNLIANDTNGIGDIFVRDRQTGEVALVSRNESGAQISVGQTSLSDDGRFVVMSTNASLVAADNDGSPDIYRVTNPLYLNATDGIDEVRASVSYVLGTDLENLVLVGSGAINGTGNGLANRITGNAAANVLDGGAGVDTLTGGAGNDTYVVNDAADLVVESIDGVPGGIDLVKSTVSFTLAINVENLTLLGTSDIDATGNELRNVLNGNTGANLLDGAAGKDTLIGGNGNDTYVVDDTGDVVTEALGGGTDVVRSSATFTLGANVENLILIGEGGINGTGNALANSITGNSGANLINGFRNTLPASIDTLIGGDGSDTYVLNNVGDVITELANEGTDTLNVAFSNASPTTTITVDLTALSSTNVIGARNVENVTVLGTGKYNIVGDGSDNVLIGNAAVNTINGDAGNDTLSGLGGADILSGGDGNDLYRIDALDTVNETGTVGSASDTVEAAFSLNLNDTVAGGALRFANIENLALSGIAAANLTGNNGDNLLTGNAGANRIDGGAGNDNMNGGAGNDTYVVDALGDGVTESIAGVPGGIDVVRSAVDFTLDANLEKLELGAGNLIGTGNALANTIAVTAGAGNNTLDGGAGADTLSGGAGDDTYIVDNVGDKVTETLGGGTDVIRSSVTFTLGANLENLILTDSGNLNGTGNALANGITGNSGNNLLNGFRNTLPASIDTLIGGDGNDTYVLNNVGDVITELANEGTDTLNVAFSNASRTTTITVDLTALSSTNVIGARNVENVTILGTGRYGIVGNGSNNVLIGNAAANIVNGGDGNDTLVGLGGADILSGGDGNDVYRIDALDTVNETGTVASASDTVEAAFTLNLNDTIPGGALRFANIENLALSGVAAASLTGNNDDNLLTGNGGANLIDGRLGNDTMAGGAGNDTYVADATDDMIVEGVGVPGGIDTVRSAADFTLPSNVEKLLLIGSAINGSGNELANTMTGNAAGNRLDGQAGRDTMVGGDGNDTYVVDDSGDTITETATAATGVDLVRASVNFTLGTNIENLILTGGADLNGTGNALANTIVGNSGDNVLNGRGGADTLTGGDGADVFEFRTVPVAIRAATVTDFVSGVDSLHFDNAIFTALGANGALTPGRFNATADGVATEADDRLVYNTSNGQLFYDTNGSAAGGSVLVATLTDQPALVATDIQVI